jgi:PAS domain S-box-containing protein
MTATWPGGVPAGLDDPAGGYARQLRYRQLVEFATEGHVATDSHGVVVEANQAAADLVGCPKEFLPGKPLGLFVAEGQRPRFYRGLARLLAGAESDEFETLVGRRGRPRAVLVRVAVDPRTADAPAPPFRWVLRDFTAQRQLEAARDDLLRRLVTAQEDERRRVARELHDSVGQVLTALLLGVRVVRDAGPLPEAAGAALDEVQRLADQLGRAVHDLAVGLRPTALDDVGLVEAVGHHLADWSARTGVAAQFQAAGLGPDSPRLPPEVETALYRVVQESLTNVARHARAGLVGVVLERQGGLAIAAVEDDGVGFDPVAAAESGRLGLLGMRERLALLGGALEVESAPGAGTTILARVPLPPT